MPGAGHVSRVSSTRELGARSAEHVWMRPPACWRVLERLLDQTEDNLESVRRLEGPGREQVVADLEAELDRLEVAYDRLTSAADPTAAIVVAADPGGEVRLQASWSAGEVVVWAAGPDTAPANHDELSDLLEAIGGPALGWNQHPGVVLPIGSRAAALSIPVADALGWLVAVGGGLGGGGVGSSVTWLGRVAVAAVRLVARGALVPALASDRRPNRGSLDLNVRWVPADVNQPEVDELAAAMPGPVTALARADAKVTRLDGSTFQAPVAAGAEVSKRLDRWTKPVTRSRRSRLVVQLDPPDSAGAWFLSVLGPGAEGGLLPVELALTDSKNTKPLADDMARLERLFPVLLRAGGQRRGQVYLNQDEAWELMTVTGSSLEAAGFDVRVPALSRRSLSPSLRLFTEPAGDTVVGARQLSDVRWSAVFDDVELTAAEVARPAPT